MTRDDIRRFVERDWNRLHAAKSAAWRSRRVGRSPAGLLADGDELRRHALSLRPNWPSPRDRADDVAVHARVSEALRAVHSRSR